MRKLFFIAVIFFLASIPIFKISASSKQAYADYLYQFDRYRGIYADFQTTRDMYLKYNSLTSRTAAVEATRTMMIQRNVLLGSYVLFLNEKLNEDWGLAAGSKELYQENIRKEISALGEQNKEIAAIETIDEATRISETLETRFVPLSISIRQTIIGITLGKLSALSRTFDQHVQTTQTLVNANAGTLTPEKIATINQWFEQIQSTKSLYQQKIEDITNDANTLFTGATTLSDIDQKFTDVSKKCTEAQKLLAQATLYLGELVAALQFI